MIHPNTCPAFFLDATIDPTGSYSPCTSLGGHGFNFANQSVKTLWLSPALEDARQRSLNGERLPMCNRCWSEEALDFVSERKHLISDLSQGLNYTDRNYYSVGPRHLNIKVSNICNLRCRTCQSKDSYLYHIEGEFYEKKYNISRTAYTQQKFKKHFTDQQLDELFEISKNLEKIELYGGEPFLDNQVPKYLNRLVDTGLSKNIDLRVSTNATHELTDDWLRILINFKNIIVNVSIDGIGEQFTYMRHPGKWCDAEKNLIDLFDLERSEIAKNNITIQPVITVSALNVLELPTVFEYFKQYRVEPFIILVQWPTYYCVNILPESVKSEIEQILLSYNNPNFVPIINLLKTNSNDNWKNFKFWTQAKDQYRNENFIETFPRLGKLLLKHNEW